MSSPISQSDRGYKKNLLEGKSFFSRLTFYWVSELIEAGSQKPLQQNDLYDIQMHERVTTLAALDDQMRQNFPKDTLIQSIIRQTKAAFFKICILSFFSAVLQFAGPFFLNLILNYLMTPGPPTYEGYLYACLMFICFLFRTLIDQQSKQLGATQGLQITNRVYYRIFKKLLSMSSASKVYYDMGKVNTIVLMNMAELAWFFAFIPTVVGAPLLQLLATIYIIQQVGWIGFIGPVLLFIFNIGIDKLNRQTIMNRVKQLGISGERSKLTNEYFQGIRILKYYAWEQFVIESFEKIREKEISLCKDIASQRGIIDSLSQIQPALISIAIFGAMVANGQELNVQTVFTVLSLLNMLQVPTKMIIMANQMFMSARSAFNRIDSLIGAEDKQPIPILDHPQNVIEVSYCSLSWTSVLATSQFESRKHFFTANRPGAPPVRKVTVESPIKAPKSQYAQVETLETHKDSIVHLSNLNFSVKQGELIGIIGQVGSGKSSLINALLGEMTIVEGRIQSRGTIAYISQNVWLRNTTLRQNILFGLPYDENRYNKILRICELKDDIAALPGGDMTEIGERGINLSGGQKQRIAIARAVYADCDIYYIDDCLSALDSYVGKRVFHNVIEKELVGKTRVVVTHQLSYLKYFDRIAILSLGKIVEMDTFTKMSLNRNSNLLALQVNQKKKDDEVEEEGQTEIEVRKRSDSQMESVKKEMNDALDAKKKADGQMIGQEEQQIGSVPWEVYKYYFSQAGRGPLFFAMVAYVLSQTLRQLTDWWLAMWSSNTYPLNQGEYIAVYSGLMLAATFVFWMRFKIMSEVTTRSSKNIFEQLITRILRAPLQWFDVTPIGRVITRCTKNIDDIDYTLSMMLQFCIFLMMQIVCTFGMISIISPYFSIICVVCTLYYLKLIRYYLLTAREIKRILDIVKAPLIGVIQEASQGVHVIRPFNRQDFYLTRFFDTCEHLTVTMFHEQWAQRWITIRSECFGTVIILACALLGASTKSNSIEPKNAGLIGVSLMSAVGLSILLPYMVDILTLTETMMSSVQRVFVYSQTLPQELAYDKPEPPKSWPQQGVFQIKNICYRYRDGLPDVIHSISFEIKSHEKIGVIGRTGSGKSTMTLGLLRILELSANEKGQKGSIVLDGIDLSEIGLLHVRSRISIIPQDPVLFSGDLRRNIDPFHLFQDCDIIECLKKVQLEEILSLRLLSKVQTQNQLNLNIDKNQNDKDVNKGILDIKIEEGGSNFSLGEKQLICLARALIKKPLVLLMDEATASIDEKTDHIIQSMIKTEFKNATVITIAHRLNTIIQYDRVLILADGNIEEYEKPSILLANPKSYLTKLVSEQGADYFKRMKYLADNPDVQM